MRAGLTLAFALAACATAASGARAATTEAVSGTVLMREPSGNILMHHDASRSMPAMTMEFALPPGTVVASGDRIHATADTSKEPWLLEGVRVTHARAVSASSHAMARPLAVGDAMPDEAFTDERGRPFSLASMRGHPFAITFVYTRCRDARMCPLISSKLTTVQRETPPSARLVEVTLDPEHDRPATLAAYGRLFGDDPARFRLIAASPIATARFASRFGILARRTDAATIVHSERLALVDGSGRVRALFDNALWSPTDVAKQLAALR